MTDEFMSRFCDAEYKIDSPKLVRFVSENMPASKPILIAAKSAKKRRPRKEL